MTKPTAAALSIALLLASGCSGGSGDDDDTVDDAGPDAPIEPDCPDEPVDPAVASEEILAYDAYPAIELVIPEASMASLAATPREDVPAELIYDGESHGMIGVHLKGQNSFLPIDQKASFRLKIDWVEPCKTFFGLKDMTLNNMSSDPTMMRERLAYMVMRAAGMPASRANHLMLTVNGELYGLYANVETVKKRMVKRYFDDNDGPLYSATDVDFTAALVPNYELESGEDDRSLLEGLAAALAMPDADAAIAAARDYADVDQFVRYWATVAVIGHLDGIPYSNPGDDYFLYADPTSGRLKMLPWGMDESFTAADFDIKTVFSVFATQCEASVACMQAWTDQVWDVTTLIEDLGLDAERARVAEEIAPLIEMDTRKPYGAQDVTDWQMAQYFFIHERREWLEMYLPPQD